MEENIYDNRIEIEEALLGILITEPEKITEINDYLSASDFSITKYSKLFDAIQNLTGEHGTFDPLMLEEELKLKGILNEIGGRNKITELMNNAPISMNIDSNVKMLKNRSIQTKVKQACLEIQDEIKRGYRDYKSLIEFSQQKILTIDENENTINVASIKDIATKKYNNLINLKNTGIDDSAIKTNFKEYDRITGGLNKSDLLILAARPAMGKTAFALNLATNVAKQGKKVLMFSLEMGNEQLLSRILSSVSNVSMSKITRNELDEADYETVSRAIKKIQKYNLYISEKAGVSILEIRNIARRFNNKEEIDFIIIDYLQLITGSSKYGNREQEVSEISRSLKNLARELDVPILALSQLSRGVESRTDKRPMLSDLRESGAIEQDADQVMFLYRDKYYRDKNVKQHNDEQSEEENKYLNSDEEIAELIIGKHRNGQTGTINLALDLKHQKFKDVFIKK